MFARSCLPHINLRLLVQEVKVPLLPNVIVNSWEHFLMSNIKISNLAGSDLFATEESFISELSTTDTNAILGGGHGKRGSGKRRGSGKSGRRGSGKSSKRRFGGGSSRGGFGHGGGCGFGYCNPYCRS
jgi:hypothetical protein